MYLMYVDESGDCGLVGSPTRHFVLTGLVVHELGWEDTLRTFIGFRREMKSRFGLGVRDELHAGCLMSRPGKLVIIKKYDRLAMIREFADCLAGLGDLSLITVIVDKAEKDAGYDVFGMAWRVLLQRFENTLSHRNFQGPANPDERGMLFPDRTDDKKLTALLRQMRHWNPVPHQQGLGAGYRNLTIQKIVEDPNFRDSAHSYFIQAADLAAYLVYQGLSPSAYMRKKAGRNYYKRLEPIFCTAASATDPRGFVRL